MQSQIIIYLALNGKCREAMTFYHSCLGGELTMQTVAESPASAQCPASMQDQIMHSMLRRGAMVLMASDMSRGEVVPGNNFSICINCGTKEEIETYFRNLSDGGEIISELKVEFWGGLYGEIKDKFGFTWVMNYDANMQ